MRHAFYALLLLSISLSANAKVHSLEEIITQVKEGNLNVKAKAEHLFQAEHSVRVAIGRLTPSLNLNMVFSILQKNYLGAILTSMGFLYPSNWFRWKENKILYEAERNSYASFLAHEIHSVKSMYYRINHVKNLLALQKSHLSSLQDILALRDSPNPNTDKSKFSFIEIINIIAKAQTGLEKLEEEYLKAKIELANGIDLPMNEWLTFDVEDIELPHLETYEDLIFSEYNNESLKKIPEIKTMDYLILASQYALKTRAFEFFNLFPNSDGNIGIGYPAFLKVQKSKTEEIKIHKEIILHNIYLTIGGLVHHYNEMIRLYKINKEALTKTLILKESILEDFLAGDFFKLKELADIQKYIHRTKIGILEAQVNVLVSQDHLYRITKKSEDYKDLIDRAPRKPKHLKLLHRAENLRFERELARGAVHFPLNEGQ